MDFLDAEAEESDNEEDVDETDRVRVKRVKAVESDDEEDEDDEERMQEELRDLIDDNPIEEDDSGDESDTSKKRKKSDDEDFDDRLEDEDYDLIEENLGVKVQRRKRFRRLRQFEDDDEATDGFDDDKEYANGELHEGVDNDEDRNSERGARDEMYDDDYSDTDDFIVDDDGRPITERRKRRKPIFSDAALQEAQDIFGVDFDYDELDKYDEEAYDDEELEDEDEEYLNEEDLAKKKKPKKSPRKKMSRKSIFDIYEPSELKRGHFTDLDNQIRNNDMPERMQLRDIPFTAVPEDSDELDEEAEWIYKQVFCKPTISTQECRGGVDPRVVTKKGNETVHKIKKSLDFMRNQQYEVPFLAFYRKEYVLPELAINDLWKVFKYDAKWCLLKSRKNTLLQLFENMRNFQTEEFMKDIDAPIPDNVRILTEEDINNLKSVQTTEELKDVQNHFLLYYGHLIPSMQEKIRAKEREAAKLLRKQSKRKRGVEDDEESLIDNNGEDEPEDEELDAVHDLTAVKPAVRSGPYSMCRKAGIDGFAKRFGLKPEEFAVNMRDNYQRHDVDQEQVGPMELAAEYVAGMFKSCGDVLKAAKFMVAMQLAREPLVKKVLRDAFYERAKINVKPTKKGLKEIDEVHQCFSMKYLKSKPVRELTGAEFLKLHIAEQDKLLTITFDQDVEGLTTPSYLQEIKQLYHRDEFSKTVQEWNELREECLELAYKKMLMPEMVKEIRAQLLAESKECVLGMCSDKLYDWLKVAPFTVSKEIDEEDDEWDPNKGIRIMAIAYVPDLSQSAFACIITSDGECTDHLRLPHLLKRKNSYREDERRYKLADMQSLRQFISSKKPHVVCIGGESREAIPIKVDVEEVISQLMEDEQFPSISVEIIDNELAKVYANSIKGENDFRDYPMLLRQAISLARRMLDPLVEFSQLCTNDDEISCLRLHPLQDYVSPEDLSDVITREFVNRTNEVGVDINQIVQRMYSGNLLQFVCGLGPRKAAALIKLMKQTNQRLENRTQLVTVCHMGPKIFINCAGFIKIDTNSLGDSTEAYVEILDGSRVHPETYEWARKMAVDALEYDDEEANPSGALEEILDAPERLKDLDLDAFAEELERQGFGNKSITLYDIRAELNCRYKDLRISFKSPTPEQLFDMLTKEGPESFYIGKLVLATVIGISRRKPKSEELDQANPVRKDETGLWQCPFCLHSEFPELSEVWNHFDAGSCPGQATGVRVKLDNGVTGRIQLKNLSDKEVTDPEQRVNVGQLIHCRILKIDVEKFAIEATSKTSDLNDSNNEWRPPKDSHYDFEMEENDKKMELARRKVKSSRAYVKRVIVHPAFHNISFDEAIKLMKNMDQGEVIIRPSSKGVDHLTVTWKVADSIYQHIDVIEKNKMNAFSLGQSLWIDTEEFEDLDEIIARHISPMASHARDLLNFRYYRDTKGGKTEIAEEFLRDEKKKNPTKIHYVLSAVEKYPGKFLLSYLPRMRCRHEYITVTPDGFRFRQQVFESLTMLFRWFKEHFRDPPPGASTSSVTPRGDVTIRNTPFHPQTPMVHALSAMTPRHVVGQMHTQTPHYPVTPGAFPVSAYPATPYTPSCQTPYMTPYHPPQTPRTPFTRYGQQTPGAHMHVPANPTGTFLHPASVVAPHRPHQKPPVTASPDPRVTPAQNAGPNAPSDPSDWAKIAEEWARKRQTDPSSSKFDARRTPRESPRYPERPKSSSRNSTPRTPIS